jgi:CHAT domain-containing protein
LIWQPLEEQLTDIKKIYFSPSGILTKIPFAALTVNDSTKLCDKYSLVQLNTTASVLNFTDQYVKSPDRLYLYGGVQYDGDTAALRRAAIQYNKNDIVSRALPDDIERGSAWQYLPDTKTEVENIEALASNHHIRTNVFTGWNATEESVKSLAGSNSPEVLHIATHGFFFSDPKKKSEKSVIAEGRIFRQSDNQLMRSGLILAGANYAWNNKPLSGLEDGILTAYVVSNLYFPNTKLAVLSACETGLGEIQSSEGVYGLQRAFKMAGVKNLIMSLWNVPDAETAEFMTLFYKNLFSGLTIDEGFRQTQSSMKKKYKTEPYKWAAWILVK